MLAVMPELCCARDDRTGGPMTLHDCMEYAISHSTKMRIANAAKDDARIARRDAALALFTPQINANTYAYYNFGRSIDPQTNTYFKTTSFHNSYSVSAGYDLFDGFQTVNNYRIAKTGILIAASEEKQAEADICLAVMEAYYNVVYYKRLTQVYEQQVETAEKTHEQARRQEEMGRKSHADVIQTEADLAERRYELTNMQNEYRAQYLTLTDLMFWPQENELLLDTSVFRRSNHSVFAERIDTSVFRRSNHSVFAERIYARPLSTPAPPQSTISSLLLLMPGSTTPQCRSPSGGRPMHAVSCRQPNGRRYRHSDSMPVGTLHIINTRALRPCRLPNSFAITAENTSGCRSRCRYGTDWQEPRVSHARNMLLKKPMRNSTPSSAKWRQKSGGLYKTETPISKHTLQHGRKSDCGQRPTALTGNNWSKDLFHPSSSERPKTTTYVRSPTR